MNQKANNERGKVKNPLDPAFKHAADNRAAQLDPKSEKFKGSEQKSQGDTGQQGADKKTSK
jgi:hypothetical protein